MQELSTREMALMRGGALGSAGAISLGNVALAMPIYISVLSNGIFGTGGSLGGGNVLQIADATAGTQGLVFSL